MTPRVGSVVAVDWLDHYDAGFVILRAAIIRCTPVKLPQLRREAKG